MRKTQNTETHKIKKNISTKSRTMEIQLMIKDMN